VNERAGGKTGKRGPIVAIVIIALIVVAGFVFRLLQGLDGLDEAGVFGAGPLPPVSSAGALTAAGQALVVACLELLLAAVSLVILTGILLRKRWAWVSAMTWVAIALLAHVIRYFQGEPRYLSMLAEVVLVLALNRRAMRHLYSIDVDRDEPGN
jgi:hypothetical protein